MTIDNRKRGATLALGLMFFLAIWRAFNSIWLALLLGIGISVVSWRSVRAEAANRDE